MFDSIFEIAKIVMLVTVVIPMMIGFVFSVLGLATIEVSRFSERRRARTNTRVVTVKSPMSRPVVLAGADT